MPLDVSRCKIILMLEVKAVEFGVHELKEMLPLGVVFGGQFEF